MDEDMKIDQLERLTELTLAARRTVATLLEIEKKSNNARLGELYDILVTLEEADAPARNILARSYNERQKDHNTSWR